MMARSRRIRGAKTTRQRRGITRSSDATYSRRTSYARRLQLEALEDRRMLSVTTGFTGPYAVSNWTSSGILGGTTTKLPASGDSASGTFGYNVTLAPGSGVSLRLVDFALANSSVTGSVTFDYTYTGNHRYFQAAVDFNTLSGATSTSIVNNVATSGSFSFSGSSSFIAIAGQSVRFRIGGKNNDSDSHIDGTLTISNIKFYDSIVVDNTGDVDDGNYGPGQLTLREAVNLANSIAGIDKITFAPSLAGQTIKLGGTELAISQSLTIDASSLASPVTIDAQQQSRVLHFTSPTGNLALLGLTITGGKTTAGGDPGKGGGINFLSSGALNISQCTVSGNTTTGFAAGAGGIYVKSGRSRSTKARSAATPPRPTFPTAEESASTRGRSCSTPARSAATRLPAVHHPEGLSLTCRPTSPSHHLRSQTIARQSNRAEACFSLAVRAPT